jgi:hypothetical protein
MAQTADFRPNRLTLQNKSNLLKKIDGSGMKKKNLSMFL